MRTDAQPPRASRCCASWPTGYTDNEIAEQIYVSPRTVQNHLARIRDKTGLRRRSELTRWAVLHAVY